MRIFSKNPKMSEENVFHQTSQNKNAKPQLSFDRHLFLVQFTGIILAVGLCAAVSLIITISSQIKLIKEDLLSTANILALAPSIVECMENGAPTDGCYQFLNKAMTDIPDIHSIELADENGVCILTTDPSHAQPGVRLSDMDEMFPDRTESHVYRNVMSDGTKCYIAGTPVYGANGNRNGYIFLASPCREKLTFITAYLPSYFLIMILLSGMGYFLVSVSQKQIRQLLKGYNPEQFSQIYDGSTNVLDNIEEGVVAINTKGRITIINTLGREILGLPEIQFDQYTIQELLPESRLPRVLETEQAFYNEHIFIHGKNLLITHLPLYSNGKLTGAVSLFHNASIINEMAQQLEDAHNMVDTLRIYNHEFMNKLHVILGYLENNLVEEAKEYLLQSSMKSSQSISSIIRIIHHQGVAAIIIGKMFRASELNISLKLMPESYCDELTKGVPSSIYVTTIGNLLQNAIEELNCNENPVKEIQLTLFIDRNSTYISVLDTGRGMSPELIDRITEQNTSTKGEGRGNGLYLVKTLLNDVHGTLRFESDPNEGTVATVTIQDSTAEKEENKHEI